jgi:hypothetical protein
MWMSFFPGSASSLATLASASALPLDALVTFSKVMLGNFARDKLSRHLLILHELFLEYFVFAGNLFQDQF